MAVTLYRQVGKGKTSSTTIRLVMKPSAPMPAILT
jgi:hypothetical protein